MQCAIPRTQPRSIRLGRAVGAFTLMAGTYAPVPSMGDLDDEERLADDRELSQRRKVEELQNIYSANREDEHISTDEARAALAAVEVP